MRKPLHIALLAGILFGVTPAPAAAQLIDICEWFERMSGPRFRGKGFDFPIACHYSVSGRDGEWMLCNPVRLNEGQQRRFTVGFRYGKFGSGTDGAYRGDNNLEYASTVPEDQRQITLHSFGPYLTWRVHRAVDVSTAVQLNQFTTPVRPEVAFQIVSVSVPGVDLFPAALFSESEAPWRRFARVSFRSRWFLGTIDAEDFGAIPSESFARATNENVISVAIGIDAFFLIERFAGRR